MPTSAVYPGSFDPMTKGHEDILLRASSLFDRVVLGVANNRHKAHTFSLTERLAMAEESVAFLSLSNVCTEAFEGLTVEFARRHGARVIIRGLRAMSDFEYECSMSQMNRQLDNAISTVFLMAGLDYQFLSSRMVREVAALGGDIQGLVSPHVAQRLLASTPAHNVPSGLFPSSSSAAAANSGKESLGL